MIDRFLILGVVALAACFTVGCVSSGRNAEPSLLFDSDVVEGQPCDMTITDNVLADYGNFYDRQTLSSLGWGLGLAAVAANTNADNEMHEKFQSSVRGATSDEWFEFLHASKGLGDGHYSLPIFAAAWGIGSFGSGSEVGGAVGDWGERSLRGFVVGAPVMYLLQRATGGSRPDEIAHASRWRPLEDDNGVSGHSFMSALPFITAAKMTEDKQVKAACYAGSVVGPLSRINDGAHYPTQAALGWWLAYLSCAAVADTEKDADSAWQFVTDADADHVVFGISREY